MSVAIAVVMLGAVESGCTGVVSLALDEIRKRLGCMRASVAREFEQVPVADVNARFDAIATALLSDARFGDFVPVLAWQYSRQELQAVAGLSAGFRPDPVRRPG
jgi:hypothetical protein